MSDSSQLATISDELYERLVSAHPGPETIARYYELAQEYHGQAVSSQPADSR